MAAPSRSHCTLIAPRPSTSAMALVLTVSTWSSVAVPLIVGTPVGASFTFVTETVTAWPATFPAASLVETVNS